MSNCDQETITYNLLCYLKNLYSLNIKHCCQKQSLKQSLKQAIIM